MKKRYLLFLSLLPFAAGAQNVSGCGENSTAQLGIGTYGGQGSGHDHVDSIVTCAGGGTYLTVATGYFFSMGLKADGSVWTWGQINQSGGSTGYAATPVRVGTDNDWKTLSIVGAGSRASALKTDGSLWQYSCVQNISTLPPFVKVDSAGTGWIAVAQGTEHTLLLAPDSTLWTFGQNGYGQLGDSTYTSRTRPVKIGASKWKFIAAGNQHSFGIRADGTLWAWGHNEYRELGTGSTSNYVIAPRQVGTATNWASVANCDDHTLGIRTDGTMWGWGNDDYGELGDFSGHTDTPRRSGTASNWISVSVGDDHSIALQSDSTIWGTGYNGGGTAGKGALGLGNALVVHSWTKLSPRSGWNGVAAGRYHSFFLGNAASQTGVAPAHHALFSFALSPVPARDVLRIRAESLSESYVTDNQGRVLLRGGDRETLDVSGLAPGLYQCAVVTRDGQRATQTFVKQ